MTFLVRRALHIVSLLAAVSVGSFLLAELAPGDYFSEMRADQRLSAESVAGMRQAAGLDRPLAVRYGYWLSGAIRGDFGVSLAYHAPVAGLVAERLPATLLLAGSASLLAWLVALPLGIWAAAGRGTWRDRLSGLLLSVLLSVPDLLIALALLAIAVATGWFPAGGMTSPGVQELAGWDRFRDLLRHLALPALALALGLLPALARHVRTAMAEVMDSPFALAAAAQGIPRRRRLFRHLLPAALHPLLSLFGLSVGTLLSSSLLVEIVMGWPGLGPLFLDALTARDFPLALAVILLSTAMLAVGNLVADLLMRHFDPRTRGAE